MVTISKHLLLISPAKADDSPLLAALGGAGYRSTLWSGDAYASATVGTEQGDLVVIDLHRSDVRTFADLERRRRTPRNIPLLVVLRDGDPKQRVEALDAGADDCLSRPFDPDELRARLDALSRRNREQKLRLGRFVWHWAARQASIGSDLLLLSPCETLLLEELLKSPDRVVSTETLTKRIERANSSETLNRLYVYICRLRKKLATARLEIRSSSGRGYALDTRAITAELLSEAP